MSRPATCSSTTIPYQGGSHLPDVNVVAPAFHEGRLLGFGCVRAHWPDIGSATPGSYGAVTEIYGEGLRLPPIRLYRDGKPDPAIEAIIFANVRTPTERLGDLRAQVAANWRAAARLQALAAKYGTDTLLDIMQEVQDYSETMMRAALRALPDGEAEFSDIFDGDGIIAPGEIDDETFTVKLRITKRGDTITADFTGSDPQVAGPMNAPLTVTASGVFCALKMIADPKSLIPPNSGCWRPVTVTAPPGSVVNAQLPAPVVYANHEMSHRVADMVMAAMFAFTPRTVMAGSQGTSAVMTFGGTDYRTDERYVSYESVKGGFGARPVKDGINAVASTVSNMMNTPIEIIEMSFPLRVRGIRAGAGQRRCRHLARRPRRASRVARAGAAGPCRGLLRTHRDAAVRACRRQVRRAGEAGTDPAERQCAQAHQQGRLHRAGRFAGGDRGARFGRLRPAGGTRSRTAFRRPAGRIRYRVGGAARLWCRAGMSNIGRAGNVRHATGDRAEEPVSDGGGGRQVVLVVRLRQERQSAVLRRLAQGQRLFPGRVQGGRGRHGRVLRLQEQRQQAALRRNASEFVAA